MKAAVFGATGGVGYQVVKKLAQAGYDVVAVSRSKPDRPSSSGRVNVRVGDMTNHEFVRLAVADCDVVLICLGINRKSKNLWSAAASPLDLMSRVMTTLLAVIGDDPSKRLIDLSAFGVGEVRKHSFLFRLILRTTSIHHAYIDHARVERMLRSSPVNWTIVKPPGLNDKDDDVRLEDRQDDWTSFDSASRKSVAQFMVDAVTDHSTYRKVITVGTPKGSV